MSEIAAIPAPDTSPEKAIPVPAPPSPPSIKTLKSWAPLYLKKTDATISQLSKILSTPSGTDTLLLTLGYGSLLTSNVLARLSLSRIQRLSRQLIESAISLPPNTTVIIDTSSIPPSRLLITSQRLKALSDLISDFRIFARLWGLLGIWKWGKKVLLDLQKEGDKDWTAKRIEAAQVIVNLAYQYLENGAYLSSKGVLGWSKEQQGKAWLWSSRFWVMHVGLDFWRLGREWTMRRNKGKGKEVDHGVISQSEQEWKARWRREMVLNMAWAPLTVHWSLEQGLVSDFWVGVLGTVAGITGLRELWKQSG
ncbi:uncharacterized protein LY89DRAFT_638147 [Mollisia scopiformis]|uniref:Peroxin 11C n=1 Tax=Mollisia scopiformis TaxID=149040 RepID=A0A194XPA5_MOLSC|nr:uncharacterized protein LY89DRAFT_638147 [Mollisia scopiformis]KUJ22018.1 hypothetical protein LY89DRAFT_638147 [Mollisia scopiformis]